MEGGYVFTHCVNFDKYVDRCRLFVCSLTFESPTGHDFKPIFMKLQQMPELVVRQTPIYFFEVKRSKGHHRPKVNNFFQISKILNFHLINFKFEDDLHIRSLNSTTYNYS